jgi:hypothetical protein
MDILKMIADLHEERARLDDAIMSLEKLSQAGAPRRGRPPAWTKVAGATGSRGRNGQSGSSNGAALSATPEG